MGNRDEVKAFLSSRRAKITAEQAGLVSSGRSRRVPGLRRGEVADLAGVSVEYYARLERGDLSDDLSLVPAGEPPDRVTPITRVHDRSDHPDHQAEHGYDRDRQRPAGGRDTQPQPVDERAKDLSDGNLRYRCRPRCRHCRSSSKQDHATTIDEFAETLRQTPITRSTALSWPRRAREGADFQSAG